MIKKTIVILLFVFLVSGCTRDWNIANSGLDDDSSILPSPGEEVVTDSGMFDDQGNSDSNKPVDEMSHSEFIDFIGDMACESMRKTGVPASVTVAQAIQETGWGKYTIEDAKNLFGVKGVGTAGSIEVETRECNVAGDCYTTSAKFRKYNSFQESVDDHAQIFSLPYYREAMKHIDDPDEFARQLTGVYATDPNYGSNLISIMKSNDLYAYDAKCRD